MLKSLWCKKLENYVEIIKLLKIIDTAVDINFNTLKDFAISKSNCFILVFSLSDRETVLRIKCDILYWKSKTCWKIVKWTGRITFLKIHGCVVQRRWSNHNMHSFKRFCKKSNVDGDLKT